MEYGAISAACRSLLGCETLHFAVVDMLQRDCHPLAVVKAAMAENLWMSIVLSRPCVSVCIQRLDHTGFETLLAWKSKVFQKAVLG